ncbi:MAG: NADH:ubiquinone oxidoreductase [Bacteroidetes bacterium]|nr:NADH:ubiquinone oxidoreductase [Bacteroidota bacterium]
MLDNLKILYHQGKQFIPNVQTAKVPGIFRGRPIISSEKVNEVELVEICPTNAITANPLAIDLGKCTFCGECAKCFPNKIQFTTDYKLATNLRENLIVKEGDQNAIQINQDKIRNEIKNFFGNSLKLRQVCAGGDNSCEWELNAANNVQFDMGRFGIEFVASPRHADGIVITGPITENMAEPLQICYDAIPNPKIIVLASTDAISGGIFENSPAVDRSFLNKYPIDLYLPGNPVHPLTIINGLLGLTKR